MDKLNNKPFFILTNTLLAGGAERQSIYLAKALSKKYQVNLIVYYGNQCDKRYLELASDFSNKIIFLSGNHVSKLFFLFKLFCKNKNAVIISYLATTNLINALIGGLAGINIKIGGIRSSTIKKYKFYIHRFLHNRILSYTVSNNNAICPYLIENGFNPDKLSVIHNCIDNVPAYFTRNESQRAVKILSLSRFVWQKDLIIALKAIEILNRDFKKGKFQFILAGYGPEEQSLRNFITENKLQDFVKIVINPNVEEVLREADIFLITSIFEGTSNSIMEAMAYGLPIVATDAGDSKYLVQNGVTGYICQLGDFVDIAKKIQKLIESFELRTELGYNGYNKIKSEFSVEKMLALYINLIEKSNK